jgi:hypothetical protein
MSKPNNATVAQYYITGIETGLASAAQAREWALSLVEALDVPPVEILEVAVSRSTNQLLESLNAIDGERDTPRVGRWLLAELRQLLQAGSMGMKLVVQRAMLVARSTNLGDEVYYSFDNIDDELALAEGGFYGDLGPCHVGLVAVLQPYTEHVANAA